MCVCVYIYAHVKLPIYSVLACRPFGYVCRESRDACKYETGMGCYNSVNKQVVPFRLKFFVNKWGFGIICKDITQLFTVQCPFAFHYTVKKLSRKYRIHCKTEICIA